MLRALRLLLIMLMTLPRSLSLMRLMLMFFASEAPTICFHTPHTKDMIRRYIMRDVIAATSDDERRYRYELPPRNITPCAVATAGRRFFAASHAMIYAAIAAP